MSEFKNKSDCNIQAAKLMQKNSLFAPSIHCAYYSCIQLMLHVIFYRSPSNIKDNYEDLWRKYGSSHKQAIKVIEMLLLQNQKRDAYKTFQNYIAILKTKREEADYTIKPITQEISYDTVNKAETIIYLLRANFN